MELLWSEQFRVGNNTIDNDHKYLINTINEIERSMEAKDFSALIKLLDALSDYSVVHFAREEKIAVAVGYSQVAQLSHSHQELITQLDEVKLEIQKMGEEWVQETTMHFTNFLHRWLINHVNNEDLLMKPLLETFSPNLMIFDDKDDSFC